MLNDRQSYNLISNSLVVPRCHTNSVFDTTVKYFVSDCPFRTDAGKFI